ncbi:MAG: GMC family oxidoreductase [Dehalococcoidia bacterium]|nr:GMC family oxidoreductase [Dehalococcoidia bacterium]
MAIDVLVVGSGYGGSVVAARLAPHARVVLVERGRWWRPGDFPETVSDLCRAYRSARNPRGLWSVQLGRGTGVGLASAVGGSSPINYGITSRPDDHAFATWPVSAAELAPWFERARAVLRPEPDPLADELGDRRFLDLVEPGRRVDLENTIDWRRCTRCGRCVPGCNVGAKRALDETYLELALRAGAELRAETEVRALVRRGDDGYAVEVRPTGGGAPEWLHARTVVLAAGTLGTLDLLRHAEVPVGPRFGQDISLNGDALAFLHDVPYPLSGHSGAPISTSVRIPFVGDDGHTRTLMVMSGRVPRTAMRFAAAALGVLGALRRFPTAGDAWRRRLHDLRTVDEGGALSRTFMYKLDGEDSARGVARFTARGAVVDWPDYADDPILHFADQRLRAWAEAVGGTVVPNVARLPGMRSFSVHPLGGCRMGATFEDGVVDDVGRVFAPSGGVHPGLRIADGSIVPTSLGVPPSWTIAALAERIADDLVRERAKEETR